MITWVFPGQGSQQKGMGESLFDKYPELTARADDILGYSIREVCLEDPHGRLNQTQYTQPVLFIVNALSYLKRIEETDQKPDFVAGHSLGEYNALFAAGAIDFQTDVKLVKKRGELMGRASGGAMAAVVKLSENRLLAVIEQHELTNIDVANYNSPTQIVISGPKSDIEQAADHIKAEGGLFVPLNVSAAFHSRHMQPARDEFDAFLRKTTFSKLRIPVVSNVTARPHEQSEIAANLSRQITHSVKWTESIRYLMGKGNIEFEEIGPGTVLTKLVAAIQTGAEPLIVEDKPSSDSSENQQKENPQKVDKTAQ